MNCTWRRGCLVLLVSWLWRHSCISDSRRCLPPVLSLTGFTRWSFCMKGSRCTTCERKEGYASLSGRWSWTWHSRFDLFLWIHFLPLAKLRHTEICVLILSPVKKNLISQTRPQAHQSLRCPYLCLFFLLVNKSCRCCINPQYPDIIGRYLSQRGLRGALWHFA